MGDVAFTDLVSAEKQAELEAKYGELRAMRHHSKPLAVILREPKRGEYKMYRAGATNERTKADAQETLFKQICVVPEGPAAVEQLLDQWPAAPEACSSMIEKLAGLTGVEQGKG